MQLISNKTGLSNQAPGTEIALARARLEAAGAVLDSGNPMETGAIVSFLVNALYLLGGQTVAMGDAPEGVSAELTRLGHRVRIGALAEAAGRGTGAVPASGKPPSRRGGDAGADRIFLAGTFGRGGDFLGQLRGLRKALRPGGLLAFHVIDRDRAWERTGNRRVDGDGDEVRIAFDPADGRLTARVVAYLPQLPERPDREWTAMPAGPAAAIQTWNLGELRALVQAAGLEWERAYGDWNGGAPGVSGSGRLIVVAARPIGRRLAGSDRFRAVA